jgi:hypothetical protein
MKNLLRALLVVFAFLTVTNVQAQKEDACPNPNLIKDTTKKSIRSIAQSKIGAADVAINYHSPGVRKRIIWGGLVPYDEVWVTGAHDATTLEVSQAFVVGGKEIPAGKYAFFTIPGKNEWTLIINKNWEQHLAGEYDEADDIVRVKVKPKKRDHIERLQYFISEGKNKDGKIGVAWEKLEVELPIKIKG